LHSDTFFERGEGPRGEEGGLLMILGSHPASSYACVESRYVGIVKNVGEMQRKKYITEFIFLFAVLLLISCSHFLTEITFPPSLSLFLSLSFSLSLSLVSSLNLPPTQRDDNERRRLDKMNGCVPSHWC
jgi:hypothetical protein